MHRFFVQYSPNNSIIACESNALVRGIGVPVHTRVSLLSSNGSRSHTDMTLSSRASSPKNL